MHPSPDAAALSHGRVTGVFLTLAVCRMPGSWGGSAQAVTTALCCRSGRKAALLWASLHAEASCWHACGAGEHGADWAALTAGPLRQILLSNPAIYLSMLRSATRAPFCPVTVPCH